MRAGAMRTGAVGAGPYTARAMARHAGGAISPSSHPPPEVPGLSAEVRGERPHV